MKKASPESACPESILIIGGSSEQKPLVKRVKKRGYITHVFDLDPACACSKIADHFYPVSIYEPLKILPIAKNIHPILVLSIASDQGNKTANYISEQLGLPSNGLQTAEITADKHKMKKVLFEHGLPTPASFLIQNEEEIQAMPLSYPFIIKAADRTGGRGVQLVHNEAEFHQAFQEAKAYSFKGKVLVEEYFQGKQYSIETISAKGVHQIIGITEEFYSTPPRFVETQHFMQARLDQASRKKIKQLVEKTLNAFQIKLGACHIELRMNKQGTIKIIELASRMGGDYRHQLIRLSSGEDYANMLIDVSLGHALDRVKAPEKRYSLIKWICEPKDYETYQSIKAKFAEYIVKDRVKFEKGHFEAENGTKRKGYYLLQFDDETLVSELLRR